MIEVRPEQPENANAPMFVTLLGIIVFLQPHKSLFVFVSTMALQLLRESYIGLPLSTTIEVSSKQPSNLQVALYQTLVL